MIFEVLSFFAILRKICYNVIKSRIFWDFTEK